MDIVEERDLNPSRGFGIGARDSVWKSRSETEYISPEQMNIISIERVAFFVMDIVEERNLNPRKEGCL